MKSILEHLRFWKRKNPVDLSNGISLWDESLAEAREELEAELNEEIELNKKLRYELRNELNKKGELNKLQGKLKSGSRPNDLECLLIDVVRI
ncbi:MAG: hypothetical protein AAF348_11600 [Bacteroidota bacterium]